MELFVKIANTFQPLSIFGKNSMLDVWQRFEFVSEDTFREAAFFALCYFCGFLKHLFLYNIIFLQNFRQYYCQLAMLCDFRKFLQYFCKLALIYSFWKISLDCIVNSFRFANWLWILINFWYSKNSMTN